MLLHPGRWLDMVGRHTWRQGWWEDFGALPCSPGCPCLKGCIQPVPS